MPVAVAALSVHEEPLRHDQVQMILGAGHGDVKKPPLFLDFGTGSGGEIGRQAAVHRIEEENRLPSCPFAE